MIRDQVLDPYAGDSEGLAVFREFCVHRYESDLVLLVCKKLDYGGVFYWNPRIFVHQHELVNCLAVDSLGPEFLCQSADIRIGHIFHVGILPIVAYSKEGYCERYAKT